MTAVLLALTASAAWGASDFLGGLKAKTVPLATVLFVSQGVALAAAAILLAVLGRPIPVDGRLLLSLAAGAALVTGLGLLYVALARGPVIAVAPVAAAGATLAAAIGVVGGDPLSAPIVAGFACALCGSFAAAYQPAANESPTRTRSAAPPAIGAAVAIGIFLTLLDAASDVDPFWATGGIHVAGWLAALSFLAASGPRSGSIGELTPRTWVALAAIGLCGVIADAAFATASQMGDLSVVSVLSSLYPVITMLLAFALLCERVRGVQLAGAALALTGTALLAGATG